MLVSIMACQCQQLFHVLELTARVQVQANSSIKSTAHFSPFIVTCAAPSWIISWMTIIQWIVISLTLAFKHQMKHPRRLGQFENDRFEVSSRDDSRTISKLKRDVQCLVTPIG